MCFISKQFNIKAGFLKKWPDYILIFIYKINAEITFHDPKVHRSNFIILKVMAKFL